jgi:C1A family cysteine protease
MLEAGCPVVVTMLLGARFYDPVAGIVELGAGDVDTAYHAVLAVGHGVEDRKRYILVRNSWGIDWGLKGHAWVAVEYLEPRFHKLAQMEKVI